MPTKTHYYTSEATDGHGACTLGRKGLPSAFPVTVPIFIFHIFRHIVRITDYQIHKDSRHYTPHFRRKNTEKLN